MIEVNQCNICGNKSKFSIKYRNESFTVVECNKCSFNFIPACYYKGFSYKNYKDEDTLEEVKKGNNWLKVQRNLLRFKLIKKYQIGKKLFDLGAGWGHFLYTGKLLGYDVHGIEIAKKTFDYAKNCLQLPIDNINFFDMVIEDQAYDLITMWDVLEHIQNPDECIKKCGKMLKPEGYIIFQVPQIDSFIARTLKDKWRMISTVHINYFSKKTIQRLLKREGFNITKIKSSFEFKLFFQYTIMEFFKKRNTVLNEVDRNKYFNKITKFPEWILKIMMLFHNMIYNTLSLLGIGDEMIVIANKIK